MAHPPEDIHSDAWLVKVVELAKARDQEAFAILFDRYNPEICALLSRLVDSKEEVHNLANDTFLKAWLQLPKLRDGSRFRAWLYIIATNTARDYLRRQKVRGWLRWSSLHEGGASSMSVEGHEETVVKMDFFKLALRQVPWKPRTCLLMQANGFSQSEIAKAMEISQASVGTYVSKGRTLLHQALKELEEESQTSERRRSSH